MSILDILHYPDKRLRKIAKPVKKVNKNINCIIDNMIETMYAKNGIGLAAPQVNIPLRIIVINIFRASCDLVLINPEFLKKNNKLISMQEGCLSIPDFYCFVPRVEKIKINALDRNNNIFELQADNLLSICIQHEMDHLIGKLLIDYL